MAPRVTAPETLAALKRRQEKMSIRSGELGRHALRMTAWVMLSSAVVAAVFSEWLLGIQLGLIGAACKGALIWDDLEQADDAPDVDPGDDGG